MAEETDMVMGILGILAVILLTAVLAGIITWKLLTRTDGNGSTGKKVYISRKGAYVDDRTEEDGKLFLKVLQTERHINLIFPERSCWAER